MKGRAYRSRVADTQLDEVLAVMGAVAIEGVKSCGKTETARQRARSEVLLDTDPEAARAAAVDARLVLDGATPRLLDEWQRRPALWDAVRRAVDERPTPGQFILTGSATPRDDFPRHSGAGRIGVLRMRTMTLSEQTVVAPWVSLAALLAGEHPQPGRCALDFGGYLERLVIGGWPQLLDASERSARRFLAGYVDAIVEHDIHEVSGTRRDPRRVRRFLHAYAQLTAHPATLATIVARAGDADSDGLSRFAAQPYLDALRRMMVVDEIPAWDPALRSSTRLTTTEKRMLADPSLAAALLRASTQRLRGDLNTLGFLFEALVAHDLRVYAEAADATLYHYRERDGRLEVDLIVEATDGTWIGVEVKLGTEAEDSAAASLRRLAERVPAPPAALLILTTGAYAYRREDGVWVLPLGAVGP
ncbi:MAG: ATP-binding protein [Sporichthyaceae bacterium]